MRRVQIHCDACGKSAEDKRRQDELRLQQMQAELGDGEVLVVGGVSFRPGPIRLTEPLYWWTLEETGAGRRTGMMDYCSLACLGTWATDDVVRAKLEELGS